MSKNTESIDITKVLYHRYTINNTNIWADALGQLTNKGLFIIEYNNW